MAKTKNESFLWGAATSSHQIEGDNFHNDWWAWELQGRCEGGARSGKACDHWNRFRDDLRLAADLGLNSYRFSIEWSRIEPEEGRWDLSALERYEEILRECERLRLLPMVTLHHFTLPRWLAERGGFASDLSVTSFSTYVEKVIDRLGARIPLWCTLNEPMVLVVGSHIAGFMPPGEFSPLKASFACQNLLRAHVSAYDRIHRSGLTRKGPWKECPVEVGIAHNMMDFFPDRVWHPLEQALARVLRRFYNQSWLDAVTGRKQNFGIRGMLPYAPVVPEALRRKTVDFIGLNYYTKAYVQWRPKSSMTAPFEGIPVGVEFARRGEEVSDLGWAIHPEGLRKMIRKVARYRLPIYITENGIADRDDRHRTEYLRSHLNEVKKAIENGVDLRGYYYWSLLDNFEWSKGFAPRFGLYHVDYDTLERRETSSCRFFSDWIENSRSI